MKKGVILLTGCTGVLGTAFTERYKEQFHIVGVARNEPPKKPDGYHFLQADITKDIDQITDWVLGHFNKVDLLINNAVYYNLKPFNAIDHEKMALEFQTNVIAPVELSNQLLKKCWEGEGKAQNLAQGRSIVNVSSISGVNNYLGLGQGSYSSTKAAMNTATIHMATDYEPFGIRVNAVAPTTFPLYISTNSVCEAILELHQSDLNAQVKVLDKGKQYFL